MQTNKISLSR